MICILPSNRKDRYDAIKKYCCVESPGMYKSCVTVCVSVPALMTVLLLMYHSSTQSSGGCPYTDQEECNDERHN